MLSETHVHFNEFVRLTQSGLNWKGFVPRDWARSILGANFEVLPSKHISRFELKSYCSDPSTCDESCFLACMAWGGMNRRHGNAAWAERHRWLPLIRQLRHGDLSREEAYSRFLQGKFPGLGVAYFTKLIFFVRPQSDGYILDQWTGKSICLLSSSDFVNITPAGWVNSTNTPDVYEKYCQYVEQIASKLGRSGDVVEEMLFSRGGKKKHVWRQYVVDNWRIA